jgi:hypothetical protein
MLENPLSNAEFNKTETEKELKEGLARGKLLFGSNELIGSKTNKSRRLNFKTKDFTHFVHKRLFKEIWRREPIYGQDGILGYEQKHLKYEINIPRYKALVSLLEKRRASFSKWYRIRENNPNESQFKKGLADFQKEQRQIQKRLETGFDYYKLFHVPEDNSGVPFFDLRYVLGQTSLNKWAVVIRLEFERQLPDLVPKVGRVDKGTTYPREVFLRFEKYRDFAKKNKKSNEIELKPNDWAARKTQADFPKLKIRASTLIKKTKLRRRNLSRFGLKDYGL